MQNKFIYFGDIVILFCVFHIDRNLGRFPHVIFFSASFMEMAKTLIYHSLESILNVFNKHKDFAEVSELLDIYHKRKNEYDNYNCLNEKRYPLIILEGLDGSGKTTVGKRFSSKIEAVKWQTPPESICHIRHFFDDNKALRTAFYCLGNYIAALEVQFKLKTSPVVMDRYWHSTAAYAIAQGVQNHLYEDIPKEGDEVYCWPEDLFKPDIVFLLDVSEEVRKERQSRRKFVTAQENLLNNDIIFRKNVIQIYRNMFNPSVTFINGDPGFQHVLRELQAKTKDLLCA